MSLGTTTARHISGEYGYEDTIETFHPPAVVTPEEAEVARQALVAYERYLAPTPKSHVLGRVAVAFAHWYVPDFDPAVAKGLMNDWATDLAEYPEWALDEAFAKWRRTESKRPHISDIRDLCRRAIRKADHERYRLKAIIKVAEQPKPQTAAESIVRSAVKRMGAA